MNTTTLYVGRRFASESGPMRIVEFLGDNLVLVEPIQADTSYYTRDWNPVTTRTLDTETLKSLILE